MLFVQSVLGRREELNLYLHKVVDLAHKSGGPTFYDYHRSFSAKFATTWAQIQFGATLIQSCLLDILLVKSLQLVPTVSHLPTPPTGVLNWIIRLRQDPTGQGPVVLPRGLLGSLINWANPLIC